MAYLQKGTAMSTERELTKLAALLAAGLITEELLLEQLGDESVVNKIVAMSGATVITGAASGVVSDVVDTTFDVVDDLGLNPFKW